MLVNKLKQAHKQPYEEILPPSVLQNQIRQQMVMAGVVYELMREAWSDGVHNGRWATVFDEKIEKEHFDNYLNNITHE